MMEIKKRSPHYHRLDDYENSSSTYRQRKTVRTTGTSSHHVVPLALFRFDYPDPSQHVTETSVLALAAVAYWVRAEVYPRVLPRLVVRDTSDLDPSPWQAFAVPATSWLGAAAAAAALWVALPDTWVPLGLLVLMLLLAFASHWLRTARLALEADALVLLSAAVLAFHHVAPLLLFRLDYPDPSHHPVETAVLGIAALAYGIRAELYPRLLPRIGSVAGSVSSIEFDLGTWQTFAFPVTSLLGAAAAAAALWVALPAPWVVVGWLTLVVLLGLAADWVKAETLSVETDLLAVAASLGLIP